MSLWTATLSDLTRRYRSYMPVTITSRDGREKLRLSIDPPRTAERLVLVDAAGREYHFGCGGLAPNGTFIHVATYGEDGREPYAWWSDVLEAIESGWQLRGEPMLGPQLSPLVEVALAGLAENCMSKHKGFYGEPEKKWAVERLRALWHEGRQPLDPAEIEVWAATHGWAPKDANVLRKIVEGVRGGRKFRGASHAIRRDAGWELRMVQHWREEVGRSPRKSSGPEALEQAGGDG